MGTNVGVRRGRTAGARSRTHAERLASRDGYFAPESVIRRLGNSPLTPFLGGGPAVLLQVAHPLVAAGVGHNFDYHRDLWKRLVRTLRALYLVAFGTKAEAERAGAAVQAVHAHVRGLTDAPLGRLRAVRLRALSRGRGALLPRDGVCCAALRYAGRHHPLFPGRVPRVLRDATRR